MIDSGSIWIGEQIIDGNIDLDWPGDVANRTTLRAVARGRAGRHTLGGLGQRCSELIANCD